MLASDGDPVVVASIPCAEVTGMLIRIVMRTTRQRSRIVKDFFMMNLIIYLHMRFLSKFDTSVKSEAKVLEMINVGPNQGIFSARTPE
mmetsp:Transcript_13222/g.31704  ORF Transcript_13222/g.31704 Transcript_13222/m.31704 type:complete len:88 (-) Transcript_13222:67-330(-)